MHWLSTIQLDRSDIYIAIAVGIFVLLLRLKQAPTGFWDNFWEHLSIIVMLAMFAISMMVTLHLVHQHADAASIQWAEGIVSSLILAIGSALGWKSSNGNGHTTTPTPPTDSTNPSNPQK